MPLVERVIRDNPLRRLWQPRAVARIAAPLVLIFALLQLDQHIKDLNVAGLRAWREEIHAALVLLSALIGVYTVRLFTRMLGLALEEHLGIGRARSVAAFASVILYAIVILLTISAFGNLSGLLVGGAVTGVIVGIAGQASLSNVIAGLVILFARPYTAGMYLTARAGSFGGVEYSGQVWDVSLFYTTLHSAGQEIRIPNSAMVSAVVVTRPQSLDVYIPMTLPLTVDLPVALESLRRSIAGATAARRAPTVTLESVTETGYAVSVRVFVAGESERRAVERAVAAVARKDGALAAPPDPSGAATGEGDYPFGTSSDRGPDAAGERVPDAVGEHGPDPRGSAGGRSRDATGSTPPPGATDGAADRPTGAAADRPTGASGRADEGDAARTRGGAGGDGRTGRRSVNKAPVVSPGAEIADAEGGDQAPARPKG